MPLNLRHDATNPLIFFEAKCDNPACPTPPHADSVHPAHVEPPLTDIDQINRYTSEVVGRHGFKQRDGGFLCETCHKASKSNGNRPTWDEYFIGLATVAATRATCDRKHVGCVIVRDRNVLATGYNGSIAGLDDCDVKGHLIENNHCVRTVHAEMNAVAQAAKNGQRIDGSTAYVTAFPCWNCCKVLLNAGIIRIVFDEAYRPDPKVAKACGEKGVNLVQTSPRKG